MTISYSETTATGIKRSTPPHLSGRRRCVRRPAFRMSVLAPLAWGGGDGAHVLDAGRGDHAPEHQEPGHFEGRELGHDHSPDRDAAHGAQHDGDYRSHEEHEAP